LLKSLQFITVVLLFLTDEFSRKPRCRVEQFQCKVSRQCINTEQVCDGELDCENEEFADFSDERNCCK